MIDTERAIEEGQRILLAHHHTIGAERRQELNTMADGDFRVMAYIIGKAWLLEGNSGRPEADFLSPLYLLSVVLKHPAKE